MLSIDIDSIAALDFDLACTTRLVYFDTECAEQNAKRIAFEVGKMFAGDAGKAGGSSPGGNKMPSGTRNEEIIRL